MKTFIIFVYFNFLSTKVTINILEINIYRYI